MIDVNDTSKYAIDGVLPNPDQRTHLRHKTDFAIEDIYGGAKAADLAFLRTNAIFSVEAGRTREQRLNWTTAAIITGRPPPNLSFMQRVATFEILGRTVDRVRTNPNFYMIEVI